MGGRRENSDASRARDMRYLARFSTNPQFGIFGPFGRRCDAACLQNGGAPIVSRESFNFIIMKAIFGRISETVRCRKLILGRDIG